MRFDKVFSGGYYVTIRESGGEFSKHWTFGHCCFCKEVTFWIEDSLKRFICSTECFEKYKDYLGKLSNG